MRWEDSSLAVGVASILLPSAAEGSCPVELGNPPILALILLRHKGCTVLRLRYQLHQCGALKSLLQKIAGYVGVRKELQELQQNNGARERIAGTGAKPTCDAEDVGPLLSH